MDDPSAEIHSVQNQKASSLDVQFEQQAQLLIYVGVMFDDSLLLPESGKLLHHVGLSAIKAWVRK